MPTALSQKLMRLRDRTSLGQQVTIVTTALCLAIVVVVTTSAALVARQQATARVETAMMSVATNLAERLDMRMFERVREISNVAGLAPLRGVWAGDPAVARSVIEQLQSTLDEYAWIGFALPDGTVHAASGGLLEGTSVAARPWFQAGLIGPTVQDVHEAAPLADLLPPSASGNPLRFVDVAVPVRGEDGRTIGALGAQLDWRWASAARRSVLGTLDPSLRTEIWILSRTGEVLLGPDLGSRPFDSATLSAILDAGHLTFADDICGKYMSAGVVTGGYADYPGLGWIVVARRPMALALAPANQLTLTIALIGAGIAVLAILAAWLLSRRLTRPLEELSDSIDRIGREPHASMLQRRHSSREVLQLSVAVRSLLRRLGIAESAQEVALRDAAQSRQMLAEKTQRLGEDINALQVLADTDPLTGLLNRRAFRVFGVDAMNYYKRHKRDVGVLIIDIDFFKRINDTFGHSVGDDVIKTVGRLVAGEARSIDKVARFGGEEFVVLLRETDAEGPAALGERIRAAIAGQLVEHPAHGAIHVTVSIGAASARESDRDIEDVIERADRALYAAKAAGRNRVVVAGAEDAADFAERAA